MQNPNSPTWTRSEVTRWLSSPPLANLSTSKVTPGEVSGGNDRVAAISECSSKSGVGNGRRVRREESTPKSNRTDILGGNEEPPLDKGEKVVYVGGGKKKKKGGVRGWWGKKERKKKKKNNKVIIKIKSENQNYVTNIIFFFFFLNCDFSCETKTMYQTEFFLQS
jgi:hypothetical protein